MTTSSKNSSSRRIQRIRNESGVNPLLFMMPFLVLLLLVVSSPNFQWGGGAAERSSPFGGDFLQDWVGGRLIRSDSAEKLYDLEFVRRFQHDPEVVGFQWQEQKYFPMVYPPFYYLLVSPFSLVPYRWAVFLWAAFSTSCFVVNGILVARYLPLSKNIFSLWFAAGSVFVPWLICQTMGHKSGLLLLLFSASFLLLHREQRFFAGLVFGLVSIKPQLGVVVGIAMILKRQWSFVGGAVVSVSLLVLASWLWSPQLWTDYFGVVAKMRDYIQTEGYQLADSHSLWAAARLTFPRLSPATTKLVAGFLGSWVILAVVFSLRGKLSPSSSAFWLQFSILIYATVLLSPHFYTYDLTILLLPMLLTATSCRHSGQHFTLGLVILLYALGGAFRDMAEWLHFQPSVIVMFGLILLLTQLTRRSVGPDPV